MIGEGLSTIIFSVIIKMSAGLINCYTLIEMFSLYVNVHICVFILFLPIYFIINSPNRKKKQIKITFTYNVKKVPLSSLQWQHLADSGINNHLW